MPNKNRDLVKKSLALGLGMMDLTRDKVEKMVKEIKKDITEKDKKQAVNELFKQAKLAKSQAEKVLKSQIKRILDDVGNAAKSGARKIK